MDYKELNKKNTDYLINKSLSDKNRYGILEKNRYSIQLNMIHPYVNKNKPLLDIGIRDGAFLLYLKRKGFKDLYGVDIYERSVNIAKDKGLECELTDVHTMSLNKKFSCIIMSHVLEHCPDPRLVLDVVRAHLVQDGILFIEVPIEKGKPKPTEKDAHYFNFNTFKCFMDVVGVRWKVLDKFVSDKRIKVVLRKQ